MTRSKTIKLQKTFKRIFVFTQTPYIPQMEQEKPAEVNWSIKKEQNFKIQTKVIHQVQLQPQQNTLERCFPANTTRWQSSPGNPSSAFITSERIRAHGALR